MQREGKGLATDVSGITRCAWCTGDPLYIEYHDAEWGFPVTNDARLFEKVCLEGFQSGLSWLTILRKRENFRKAFANFNIERVARFTGRDVNRLLKNEGIVRHRGKIESTIHNAKKALGLIEEFGSLAAYVWQFVPAADERPTEVNLAFLKRTSTSAKSVAMSKDLKKRGWSFVGPTTIYAFMQAMGLVNDHLEGCDVRLRVEQAKRKGVTLQATTPKPPMNLEKCR